VIASMPGAAPVVVDSAGCGAVMKEYGDLLGTDEAHRFSARVRDFSEWMVATGLPVFRSTGQTVVVQDPCHLRNVQRTHGAVRELLAGAYSLVETADDGLCCGAGGAFAVFRADDAAAIRARKVAALRAAAGDADPIVVSANPGCVMHLRAAGLDVRHPAELAAEVLE
ncbi:MAG: heterodisulfide reductase-related iron-sulfur binding cluster, partial [Actinomycetota bacterium]